MVSHHITSGSSRLTGREVRHAEEGSAREVGGQRLQVGDGLEAEGERGEDDYEDGEEGEGASSAARVRLLDQAPDRPLERPARLRHRLRLHVAFRDPEVPHHRFAHLCFTKQLGPFYQLDFIFGVCILNFYPYQEFAFL